MKTIDTLNEVIDYIEQHLCEALDMDILARINESSKSVLQKTFLTICDITISEYIRRRRLSAAAFDIREGRKIIDVAMKYQYENVDAFSRAFKQMHGITPTQTKQNNMSITFFSRIVFTLSIKGVEAMNYKIEKRPAMRLIGYKTFVPIQTMTPMSIPTIWDSLTKEQIHTLEKLHNGDIKNSIGVNARMHDDGFDYWIAVTSDEDALEDGEYIIPSCEWIKIEAKGALRPNPTALQEAYKRFFREWLPASTYEHAGYAEIEYYPMMGSDPYSDTYTSEIWISVRLKT